MDELIHADNSLHPYSSGLHCQKVFLQPIFSYQIPGPCCLVHLGQALLGSPPAPCLPCAIAILWIRIYCTCYLLLPVGCATPLRDVRSQSCKHLPAPADAVPCSLLIHLNSVVHGELASQTILWSELLFLGVKCSGLICAAEPGKFGGWYNLACTQRWFDTGSVLWC